MQAAYNGIFLLVLANTLPKFIFAEGGGLNVTAMTVITNAYRLPLSIRDCSKLHRCQLTESSQEFYETGIIVTIIPTSWMRK